MNHQTHLDNNDLIDLFYSIKDYINNSNINLLDNPNSDACSQFVCLCNKYLEWKPPVTFIIDPEGISEDPFELNV